MCCYVVMVRRAWYLAAAFILKKLQNGTQLVEIGVSHHRAAALFLPDNTSVHKAAQMKGQRGGTDPKPFRNHAHRKAVTRACTYQKAKDVEPRFAAWPVAGICNIPCIHAPWIPGFTL